MRSGALNVTAWHLGCDKTTFSHITLSLSLCLSLSSASCSVFFTLRTCVCVCAVNVSSFVWLFWLCLCVLVCCRHCSPVHCFFSVFTAHHWASLSVCLPNLHPKFRLFIYKQLVRYCTVFSTYAPSPALPCPASTPPPPHGTCLCLSTGTGTLVGWDGEWCVLICLRFFVGIFQGL